MFGGQWTFASHFASEDIQAPKDILNNTSAWFHAFIDFIWAKREKRINVLCKGNDFKHYKSVQYFKNIPTLKGKGKAQRWYIYNYEFEEVKVVKKLNDTQKAFPLFQRIDDIIMVERINKKWKPEQDERI